MTTEPQATQTAVTLDAFHTEQQNEQVLSTLNRDGSRRWLDPKLSKGRFLTGRRAVAYFLIALFTLLPYLRMNGKPMVLLDLASRRFTLFGYTFLPTDTLLLMLLMVMIFVTVFMVTAVFGRVWCGWGCPQTVYMEFVYRPLERLLEGRKGPDGKAAPGRIVLKYVVYFLISMFLAHTFLAYFVGIERLAEWVQRSPLQHPSSFLIMAAVTGLMMFDFCFFREQMCIVACPYGRFQSVMLDRQSLLVSYDRKRGEPRGKMRKKRPAAEVPVTLRVMPEEPVLGDCIDCKMCVHTCPTGIDIRNGLQMECIACAQCIDACDAVMDKVGRPRGLIRYSSQAAMEGERKRLIRPRLALYLAVLTVLASLFTYTLLTKSPADLSVLRAPGLPFNTIASGEITNQLKVKVANRTDRVRRYTVSVDEPGVRLEMGENPIEIEAGKVHTDLVLVLVQPTGFQDGHTDVVLRITDEEGFTTTRPVRLLGPFGTPAAPAKTDHTPDEEKGGDDDND
jgi:cytochrome c oxidase accessory protein FixG